jgi:hypothetical protein
MSASTADGPVGSAAAQPPPARRHGFKWFLLADSPYILMLLAALGGISYRAFYGRPILGYWEVLLVAFGALCIWAGLPSARARGQVFSLVWTQVLHWAAFLGATLLVSTSSVRSELDDDAISVLILTILALAVFLAGVHGRAWRLCVVGAVLAAGIPAVTWIQGASTLIAFCALVFVVVLAAFFLFRRSVRGPVAA